MTKKQTSQIPWYSEEAGFFGPVYFQEYAEKFSQERAQTEVDFLEKALGLDYGDTVLDCPCGQGRHSIELARRGYAVTGQDLNGFLLEKAEKTMKDAGVSVEWIKKDMREIPYESSFDAAFNIFTSFGYLESEAEDQKALNQISKALKQGGKFILDVMNRDRLVCTYKERDWNELSDGSLVLAERQFDHITGRSQEKRTYIWENDEREEFSHTLRMYTVPELIAMLEEAGFTLEETYGDFDKSPIAFDSKRYILIAQKA